MKGYVRYVRHFYGKARFGLLLVLAGILGSIPALMIALRGRVIDLAISGEPRLISALLLFCAAVVLSALLENVLTRLSERHSLAVSQALDTARLEKADRVAYPVTETGEYRALLEKSKKAPELDKKCMEALREASRRSVQLCASLAVIAAVSWETAAGLIVLLVLGLAVNAAQAKYTQGFWSRYIERMRRSNYLSGLLLKREYAAERKLFGFGEEIDRCFSGEFAQARRQNCRSGTHRFLLDLSAQVVFGVYMALTLLLLLRPLGIGRITMGTFLSVHYATAGLVTAVRRCFPLALPFPRLSGSWTAGLHFWSCRRKKQPGAAAEALHSIELRHVSFSYPGSDRKILADVSFTLKPGRHYALVGENGCGKSTLVKLLVGLYAPDSGEVRINGRPVQAYSREARRQLFSVVFQDFYSYPITPRENMTLSRGDLPGDETLFPVLEALQLDKAIAALPKGADTELLPLHQDGAGLSGGEWQKLAIARCVLSDAPAAILDEPNAALDPVSEAAVYRAYGSLLQGKTTLFISHRLGSVRMCDEILVLRDGKLIAKAAHDSLMENCPYYAQLFETQRGMYCEAE